MSERRRRWPLARGLAAVAVVLAATLPAQAQKLVPAQSEVSFTSRQMGVPVDGRFRRFDAQVEFDPKKPEAARIGLAIDLNSVAINPDSDAEVRKPAWFDAVRFPQAQFVSTAVTPAGPGRFDVAGRLGIKGQSRDIVVPVTLAQAGGSTTASGAFTIKRLDFKIGEGEWADTSMVANDVQIKFKLVLTGMAPL